MGPKNPWWKSLIQTVLQAALDGWKPAGAGSLVGIVAGWALTHLFGG